MVNRPRGRRRNPSDTGTSEHHATILASASDLRRHHHRLNSAAHSRWRNGSRRGFRCRAFGRFTGPRRARRVRRSNRLDGARCFLHFASNDQNRFGKTHRHDLHQSDRSSLARSRLRVDLYRRRTCDNHSLYWSTCRRDHLSRREEPFRSIRIAPWSHSGTTRSVPDGIALSV